jgi:hypothetical protein
MLGGVKRAMRWIFNGGTVLSLLLALAVAGSWVRSYWRYDWVYLASDDARTLRGMAVVNGQVAWEIFQGDLDNWNGPTQPGFFYLPSGVEKGKWIKETSLPVRWDRQSWSPQNVVHTEVIVPHAYLFALFAALPGIRSYCYIRRRYRVLPGHCPSCGYDLRATPDRCPECGNVATKRPA